MRKRDVCAIGVMAKAPQAGRSKTRLCPPLLPAQAAELSAAFLRDVTENIAEAGRTVPIQGLVAYAPAGSAALFGPHVAEGTRFVLADGLSGFEAGIGAGVQGFGRCLLHAVQAMLAQGFAAACVLNSDGPTLPTALLTRCAQALLQTGDRVVLGPAEDGGYYLLGTQVAHARLFADIAWSTDSVADATRLRVRELGLELVELPVWYDVDDRASLARLCDELAVPDRGENGGDQLRPYRAAAAQAVLRRIGLLAASDQAAE